ncbi:MAG: fibronectin-binding domain-containing protein [Treponema sp.]|nr:fibronectin-binding domain-containing protein [Treponema sp.]
MSLNCNEINLILEELNLKGSFIQDIIQPGYDSLALYTYKEGGAKTVFICTAHDACRICEVRRKITKNEKPLRFMEFLRSRIKGCRINSASQIGLERIIKMELSNAEEEFILYIRLWNNAANVILCNKNKLILDSMFRRPAKGEVTGKVFLEPELDESKFQMIEKWQVRDWQNEEKTSTSFNEFIDNYYSEHGAALSREALLEKAEKWYTTNLTKREAALLNLEAKLKSFKNADQLKHFGDLILAYGHLLDGNSRHLECEDYETGKTVSIVIDPKLSAHENAENYYTQYKKALSGSEQLEHDIEISRRQIDKLKKQYEEILNEKNPVKIEQMLRHDSKPVQQQKKSHPGLDYTVNGWYILVGRDANENDELLRHHVRGEDLWLHVRDFPGGYVFIKHRKDKTVPLDILLDAANLAVYYSKARNTGKTDLYYTKVKYLRRAKNGPKGLVLPTQEKNLCITPDKERLSKLDMLLNG